jgi:hypothetical protein
MTPSINQAVSGAQKAIEETLKASGTQAQMLVEAKQDASLDALQDELKDNVSVAGHIKHFKKLDAKRDINKKSDKAKEVKESVLVRKDDADSLADGFSKRRGNHEYHLNPSLLSQLVVELGLGINENSNPDEIIGRVRNRMTVGQLHPAALAALVDKGFEFLLEATSSQAAKAMGEDKERLTRIINNLETAQNKHFEANVLAVGIARISQQEGNREYQLDPFFLSQFAVEAFGTEMNANTTPDHIVSLMRNSMGGNGQNPAFVDKALGCLLDASILQVNQTTGPNKERLIKIVENIETAKNQHFESHIDAIQVAQKIIGVVDAVAIKTGKTIKETFERYRNFVHNPTDIQGIRKEYEKMGEKEGFEYMMQEFTSLRSYLGKDFQQPNLDNPEIMQLIGAARRIQNTVGVFRESKNLISMMETIVAPFFDDDHIVAA